ncbi:hypothetical protein [Streptomyces sp. NBC_01615]|uniref:hypothetical protein n=1 Tax=Streptomyces sp. NBC_01615 TaxID=2975898 RepID=UPI003865ADAB
MPKPSATSPPCPSSPPEWSPLTEEIQKLRAQDDLPSRVAEFQLTFLRTPSAELPDTARRFFTERAALVFPGSYLLVADMSQELVTRSAKPPV